MNSHSLLVFRVKYRLRNVYKLSDHNEKYTLKQSYAVDESSIRD